MTRKTARRRPRKAARYWYRLHVGECPACGRDAGYRERVPGQVPADPRQRVVPLHPTEAYCGCLDRR